jgi:hypothetical protein
LKVAIRSNLLWLIKKQAEVHGMAAIRLADV